MPAPFTLIRLITFSAIIGIAAVVIALGAHYHDFSSHVGALKINWDVTLETYCACPAFVNFDFAAESADQVVI
jgi:hypothetical protein